MILPLLLLLPLPALARDPLRDITTIYLTALTTRNPSLLQPFLAPNATITYTENTIPLPLWSGLWERASPLPQPSTKPSPLGGERMVYRHSHVDFSTGQIATVTTLLDAGIPVIYTVRLKLNQRNEIVEVEGQVVPDKEGVEGYNTRESGVDREGVWMEEDETLSAGGAWRLERGRLVELAGGYYGRVDKGRGVSSIVFGEACVRLENGREVASCGVEAAPLGRDGRVVRERRFVVQGTDVPRQSVFSFAMVDDERERRTWYVAEGLRFNGLEKIDRVETTYVEVPFGRKAPF